jgi:DNA-binding MarR family transcriptional regulator
MIKSTRTIFQRDPALEPLMAAFRRFRSNAMGGAMNLEFFVRNNLTIAQMRAMFSISQEGRLSGRQLARALHISPAAVVPLCDRLERDGYVIRVPDTLDRRVTWFELSPSGQKTLEEISWVSPSRMMGALARLEVRDREHLIRILDKLATELETPEQPSAPPAKLRTTAR